MRAARDLVARNIVESGLLRLSLSLAALSASHEYYDNSGLFLRLQRIKDPFVHGPTREYRKHNAEIAFIVLAIP